MRIEFNASTGLITSYPDDIASPLTTEQLKINTQSQIDTLEKTSMIPRITREFMLVSFAVQAASQGIDPMTNIAYSKLKALDDQIAALRSQP